MPEQPDDHRREDATDQSNNSGVEKANQWERIGRDLLAEQLEVVGRETLQQAFVNTMMRIQAGEEITQEDIQEMRWALEEANRLVDVAAEASPEASPMADARSCCSNPCDNTTK